MTPATRWVTAVRWDAGELRDWKGRWARTGSSEVGSANKHIAGLAGKVHPRELDNYNVKAYKTSRLDPAFKYTPEQEKAIRAYTETDYQDINDGLRQGGEPGEQAKALSSAMQPMPDDLVLVREVSGMHALENAQPGDVIADDGFSSTALTTGGRYASGRSDTTVLHILAPAGTPAVWTGQASGFPEDEVILDHGTPMVIMKAGLRPGRSNVRDVYLLALPKGAVT